MVPDAYEIPLRSFYLARLGPLARGFEEKGTARYMGFHAIGK